VSIAFGRSRPQLTLLAVSTDAAPVTVAVIAMSIDAPVGMLAPRKERLLTVALKRPPRLIFGLKVSVAAVLAPQATPTAVGPTLPCGRGPGLVGGSGGAGVRSAGDSGRSSSVCALAGAILALGSAFGPGAPAGSLEISGTSRE
jgi:hypothetical protein